MGDFRDWGIRGRLVGSALLAAFACLLFASQAEATPDVDYWKSTQTTREAVYTLFYDQSPQAIPSGYTATAEAEQIIAANAALPSESTASEAIWTTLRSGTAEADVALAPRLGSLGSIGLGAAAGVIGWKIGSGLNAKFLHIGTPDETVDPAGATWNGLVWSEADSYWFYGATWPAEDGWVGTFSYNGGPTLNRWFQAPCPFAGFSPPAPLSTHTAGAAQGQCSYGSGWPPPMADIVVDYAWAPENALTALGPIEPYTGQSYDYSTPAPSPPGVSSVEDGIEDFLEDPQNADLRQWFNYELGSPGEADPTGVGDDNPELPFPEFIRKWKKHWDEFLVPYLDPYEYWKDASEIVEDTENETDPFRYESCERFDGDILYWDNEREAIVIVRDGEIQTYFPPEEGKDYWEEQCARTE